MLRKPLILEMVFREKYFSGFTRNPVNYMLVNSENHLMLFIFHFDFKSNFAEKV